MEPHALQDRNLLVDPSFEMTPRLLFRRCPSYLCHREQARPNHILHMLFRSNIFRPKVGLNSPYPGRLFGTQAVGHRVIGVDLFNRQKPSDSFGLLIGGSLVTIEIGVLTGSHDDFMSLLSSAYAHLLTAPSHYDRAGIESPL